MAGIWGPWLKRVIKRAARRYHLPPAVLAGQQFIESGFQPGAVSSAGAFGISQFIPSTAASYGVKRGTSHKAVKSQVMGQAHYLSDLGARPHHLRSALGNYYGDPSSDYASRVLAAAKNYRGKFGGVGGSGGGGGGGKMPKVDGGSSVHIPGVPDFGSTQTNPYQDPTYMLNSILAQTSAQAGQLPETQQGWDLLTNISLANAQAEAARADLSSPGFDIDIPGAKGGGGDKQGGGGPADIGKWLTGHADDRAGVNTKKVVLKFAAKVAKIFGHPITLGTGTNHSRTTTSGNVSDHWTGHALDLPASGRTLIKMGQAALIAAGMSPKKAHKINGGLFNVNGHQIIFNTYEGGDHTDHLHISAYHH